MKKSNEEIEKKKKPNKYWDFETCKEEALKYNSKIEFKIHSGGAYSRAKKSKWVSDICGHMIEGCKPSGYWCFDKCKEEALKYESKKDFRNFSHYVYSISYQNGWLEEFSLI